MITFPTDVSTFVAYQEQLVGRALSEKEKGLTAAWVEIFNLFYEDGLNQDCDTLYKDLRKFDEFMGRHENDKFVHKFAKICRAWIIEAWKQGKEAAQHD